MQVCLQQAYFVMLDDHRICRDCPGSVAPAVKRWLSLLGLNESYLKDMAQVVAGQTDSTSDWHPNDETRPIPGRQKKHE
jgi:hypothetical protein